MLSCGEDGGAEIEENAEAVMTEQSDNLTIIMSENGRRSYRFSAPLVEGYMLAKDPFREFRKGINIITYKDDSLTTVNSSLMANYAIYYENRKLWEAKGNVVAKNSEGMTLYTQQLFWNAVTKRIYSNVDVKVVSDKDGMIWRGEGFESDEEMKDWHVRRNRGRITVDGDALQAQQNEARESREERAEPKRADESSVKPAAETHPQTHPRTAPQTRSHTAPRKVESTPRTSAVERVRRRNDSLPAERRSSEEFSLRLNAEAAAAAETKKQ